MIKTDTRPFFLSAESISKWQRLSVKIDTLEAANELYTALKNPAYQQSTSTDVSLALELITPTVLQISDNLFAQVLSAYHRSDRIEKKTRKIARLSSQLIRSLCLSWFNVLARGDLTENEQLIALYNAFQLVGISMRRNAHISERPSSSLWRKMGQLYRDIHTSNLTNTPVNSSIPSYKRHPCIDSVIKRNLVYGLINFYSFSPQRLPYCYEIADRCADKLELKKNDDAAFNFSWDISNAKLPSRGIITSDKVDYLYFNTEIAADYLAKTCAHEDMNCVEFSRIESSLTGYQHIVDSVIATQANLYQLIVGVAAIHSNLRKLRSISNIHRLSAELPDLSRSKAFELEPLEHEKKLTHSLKTHTETASETVSLQFAQNAAYCLVQIKRTLAGVNQPVLLIDNTGKPVLGIIRRTLNKTPNSTLPVLVEVFPYSLFGITVVLQGIQSSATLLHSYCNNDLLLLPAGKYSCGEKVTLINETEQDSYLHKLIETGEDFMLYQLGSG